jgi:ribonucleotide reductase alpha subunit
MKAFLAVHGTQGAASASVRETVDGLTESVVRGLLRSRPGGGTFHIEDIQDQVELGLMRGGHHEVARAYVLYRERRAQERAKQVAPPAVVAPALMVTDRGVRVPFDSARMQALIESACAGLGADVRPEPILTETKRNLYDGVPIDEVHKAAILAARTLIEKDPGYTRATARLLLHTIRREILGEELLQSDMAARYAEYFPQFVKKGVAAELLDEKLLHYDLGRLGAALKAERDLQFDYLGLQTLYDRYFLHIDEARIELPQAFFMRVAMGLALNEIDREERAIEFYEVLSTFDFMSSTPTLFNAGTRRSQLSSCYLTTVSDDLDGIYEALKENALLSKFAGGLGNDWTNVRALGSYIKGTNGKSQGVVPFLKVVNDTAVAVNQGGKRKGAVCAYLESWHLDIEEFLELRKNTGDDRRRTHDMNTANWVPDLLMKRVMEGGDWTPVLALDLPRPARQVRPRLRGRLHRLRGQGGARRDQAVQEGEGGRPVAAHADHAVRDRPSVDHVQGRLQRALAAAARRRRPLEQPVHRDHPQHRPDRDRGVQPRLGQPGPAHRRRQARPGQAQEDGRDGDADARQRHRHQLLRGQEGARLEPAPSPGRPRHHGLPGCAVRDQGAVRVGGGGRVRRPLDGGGLLPRLLGLDRAGRGARPLLELPRLALGPRHPADRFARPARRAARQPEGRRRRSLAGRDRPQRDARLAALRGRIAEHGMRNSNCVAIAPTATISNIVGVSASIEPSFGNLSVKSNLSGEFTIVNEYLVRDLKRAGLWDEVMVMDLKHFDGSLKRIDRVPEDLKQLYATAFEIETQWLVEAAARRQKWIDQAQSLNIYMAGASGKKLDETYKLAWLRGLKTTYYLRTQSATNAEKSTVKSSQLNAVSNGARSGARPERAAPRRRRRRATSSRATSSSARSTTRSAKRVSEQARRLRGA